MQYILHVIHTVYAILIQTLPFGNNHTCMPVYFFLACKLCEGERGRRTNDPRRVLEVFLFLVMSSYVIISRMWKLTQSLHNDKIGLVPWVKVI